MLRRSARDAFHGNGRTEPCRRTPVIGRLRSSLHRLRHAHYSERGQAAIVLVVGMVVMIGLGTTVFVATATQSMPIVQNNLATHDAYRGLQAGLNQYLYLVNANPIRVICNSGNQSTIGSCSSMAPFKFNSWIPVPNTGLNGAPTEWFAIHDPTLDATNKSVDFTIDGAAQTGTGYQMETSNINLKQTNNFLTNAWWSIHGIVDPSLQGKFGACNGVDQAGPNANQPTLAWGNGGTTVGGVTMAPGVAGYNGAYPYSAQCVNNNIVWHPPGTYFDGPIFSDDPLFVCSFGVSNTGASDTNPADTTMVGAPPIHLPINTADPNDKWSDQSCGYPAYVEGGSPPTATLAPIYNAALSFPNGIQTPPLNIVGAAAMTKNALQDGCLYEGPTQIMFEGKNGLKVISPQTPTGGAGNTNDGLITSAANRSICLPSTPGGTIPLPDNGVIFVTTLGGCKGGSGANPLQNGFFGATNFTSCEGDALVGNAYYDPTSDPTLPGTYNSSSWKNNVGLSGALTIGADNDVVIMNDITYTDCGAAVPGDSANSCPLNQSGTNDILGLIAANYVEINHPVVTGGSGMNEPNCDGNGTWPSPNAGSVDPNGLCDLPSPRVDAVTLALAHAFAVNNFSTGASLGTANVDGAIAENFVDLDGTCYNSSGGKCTSGSTNGYLAVNYHWDARLNLIAPPYYLTSGTKSWTIHSFTYKGGCSPSCLPHP